MKQKKIFFLIILFAICFAYITNIEKIPENITLFQNEQYQIGCLKGIEIDGDNIEKEENFWSKLTTINTNIIGDLKLNLSTLGGFLNKTITVSVLPQIEVIPGGDCMGVKLYSKGVLIIGESKIQGIDGNWYEPYKANTFKAGDILLKINDYEVESASEISTLVENNGNNQLFLTCERDGKTFLVETKPIKCIDDGKYKIGLWVRDGAMGIGTLTFYEPETASYAALGHGISDESSKDLIELGDGEIYDANVISVSKGKTDLPGEIKGLLIENDNIGNIRVNSSNGIYGEYNKEDIDLSSREKLAIASRNEIKLGNAKILCTVDKSQNIKEYDIEILKISTSTSGSKGMVIKVIDEELIQKTGGIIQGMSGSPIIQDGKLIGAVTHVYVSQPTKGYAIFADTMIDEIRSMKEFK